MKQFARLSGLKAFAQRRDGNIMLVSALMIPLIASAGVFASDYTHLAKQKHSLQAAADAASIAASKQLSLGPALQTVNSVDTLTAVAQSVAAANLSREVADGLTAKAVRPTDTQVQVLLSLKVDTLFGAFSRSGTSEIFADSTSEIFGVKNVCVIALQADGAPGLELTDSSQIRGGDCGIYSNSVVEDSIRLSTESDVQSPIVCAAGGVAASAASVEGDLVTDCPVLDDPLSQRVFPAPPAECTFKERVMITGGKEDLYPGNYCGGITIANDADVTLHPGVYYLGADNLATDVAGIFGMITMGSANVNSGRDALYDGADNSENHICHDESLKAQCGALVVMDNAQLRGKGVALYTQGRADTIAFMDRAFVDIEAPVDGEFAGILMTSKSVCGDNTGNFLQAITEGNLHSCHARKLLITSDAVESLLGTIYLPEDNVEINTTMAISERAAFTIIVARQLFAMNSPTLVLNTDYTATTVPVPAGLSNDAQVRLIE